MKKSSSGGKQYLDYLWEPSWLSGYIYVVLASVGDWSMYGLSKPRAGCVLVRISGIRGSTPFELTWRVQLLGLGDGRYSWAVGRHLHWYCSSGFVLRWHQPVGPKLWLMRRQGLSTAWWDTCGWRKLCCRRGCFLCRRCRSRGTGSAPQSFQRSTRWLYVEPMSRRCLDRCRLQPCSPGVQRGSHCSCVVPRCRLRLTQWESFLMGEAC